MVYREVRSLQGPDDRHGKMTSCQLADRTPVVPVVEGNRLLIKIIKKSLCCIAIPTPVAFRYIELGKIEF